jgi:RNA polymerase sigma-70 factor (ECF subfamily)
VTHDDDSTPEGPDLALARLVSQACGGDRAAFAALHERHAGMVHAILLARVPARDAEDLVQDVFLRALRQLGSLREPMAFGGWLARIARNRAIDYHRRRHDSAQLPDDLGHEALPTAEAREALAAVRALPEAYAETLLMRLMEGMTGAEIAARTGLTPGSVRVNLHRGMALLRKRLGVEATR